MAGFGSLGAFSTSSTRLSYLCSPPDLSGLSDPESVVWFKNLRKQDVNTKSKALENLVARAQSGNTEDAVLDAWVQVYPRLTIENARRIRELSHTLQAELLKSARKRMEKRLRPTVGAWLAGSFDRDRGVAKAATEGLTSLLDTEEKMTLFWRRCQSQILEFATEAINETKQTLSDERSTTREDSDAKYYRVVGSSLSLVLNLMQRVEPSDIKGGLDVYFGLDAVWSLAAAADSFVRRTLYQLLHGALSSLPDSVKPQLHRIGRVLITEALKSNQMGSAADLVKVLASLTERFPEVWGTKKHPLERVRPFLEKGSQGSSWTFWQELDMFLSVVSSGNLSQEAPTELLKAMRAGISRREEPKVNNLYAWACYINTVERFLNAVPASPEFVQANVYPLTRQYLSPDTETALWTCAEAKLLPKAWEIVYRAGNPDVQHSIQEEWRQLSENFLARMSHSSPQVSPDFQKSQEAVKAEGDRWFSLTGAVLDHRRLEGQEDELKQLRDIVAASSRKVLQGASELLRSRNFKPFGVASLLYSSLVKCPALFGDGTHNILASFFPQNSVAEFKLLLASPSSSEVISSVNALAGVPSCSPQYETLWNASINAILADSDTSHSFLSLLLSAPAARRLACQNVGLQTHLAELCTACAKGASQSWDVFETTFSYDLLPEDQIKAFVSRLLESMDVSGEERSVMKALGIILRKRPAYLMTDNEVHLQLVSKLLALTEISDLAVSCEARHIHKLLGQTSKETPLVRIIQQNLENAGPAVLAVETLVQQALTGGGDVQDLFPNSNVWMQELSGFFQHKPDASLSLTSSLGGAYLLVKPAKVQDWEPKRDQQGRSTPARMALYTTGLLSSGIALGCLPLGFQVELIYLLLLTVELTADELIVPAKDTLWGPSPQMDAIHDFVSCARRHTNDIIDQANGWADGGIGSDNLVERLLSLMTRQCEGVSPVALYTAKALGNFFQALSEAHGIPKDAEDRFRSLDINQASAKTVFPGVAFITGFGEMLGSSSAVKDVCNKLVTYMTGAFPGLGSTLYSVVLLNACFSVYEMGKVPVESRRMVIALKQMTSWTDTPDEMSKGLAAETCKGLYRLAPNVSNIYGPYWEQILLYCLHLWRAAAHDGLADSLPYLHASLKLLGILETLAEMEDTNDDLVEAVRDKAGKISAGLIGLLKLPRTDRRQASDMVDALLRRRVEKIPLTHIQDLSGLYGLVASESRSIQTTAFGLLRRGLGARQQQLSVDVVLDKTDGRLPDELLSLLLDAPALESYSDDELVQFPTAVRSYLLAWHLIFEMFDKASLKLRSDYAEHIKTEQVLGPLLAFTFDVLGQSAGHPLNLDKAGFAAEQIRDYQLQLADAEPAERSMQWLLVHVFYRVLQFLAGQFKTWFIDCRSKQTKIAVEGWTARYFSPLIVANVLDDVVAWQAEQAASADDDDTQLQVKVSRLAREVVVGYEVEDQQALMVMRIPAAYPLEMITVEGLNRVAVTENRWQAWMMTVQGAIIFSNGNIIDGLTTFRRNVVGALKGQEECAICYSIVSSDKRMPDKRCATCKHLFHRSCLYKWFQSSNQNSCPLCRNPIDYLGTADRRGGNV